MDSQQHDSQFVKTFLLVLGALGAFTVTISVIASVISEKKTDESQRAVRIEQRMKPAGEVFTDAAAMMAAAPAPAAHAPMTGDQVVAKVCSACHGSGVLGAPKIGDHGAWAKRGALAQLVASAIKGKGSMPPRGGDPSLTDDEIKAAIQVMTK